MFFFGAVRGLYSIPLLIKWWLWRDSNPQNRDPKSRTYSNSVTQPLVDGKTMEAIMTTITYTKSVLEQAVYNSTSYAGVLRYLGLKQAGGTQSYIKGRIQYFNINTSHFTGSTWNRGLKLPKLTATQILVKRSSKQLKQKTMILRRALLEVGRLYICEWCKIGETWNNKPITLEIDHIDGDFLNNEVNNLRFLCPNCHSQTSTHNRRKK